MLLYGDHKAVVYALAFSPDGSTLASGAKDGTVLLRSADGRPHPLAEWGPQAPPIHALAYLPDGSGLLVGGPAGWREWRQEGGSWHVFGPPDTAPVTSL